MTGAVRESPFAGMQFDYLDQPGVFPPKDGPRLSLQRLLVEAGIHQHPDSVESPLFELGPRHVRLILNGKPADFAHYLLSKFREIRRRTIGRFQRRDLSKREANHER